METLLTNLLKTWLRDVLKVVGGMAMTYGVTAEQWDVFLGALAVIIFASIWSSLTKIKDRILLNTAAATDYAIAPAEVAGDIRAGYQAPAFSKPSDVPVVRFKGV